jgi:hypothetical protein
VDDAAIKQVGLKRFAEGDGVAWLENSKDNAARRLATKRQSSL